MRAAVACLLVAARANALSTTRRKLLIAPLAAPLAAPVVATRANAVEQQMRTSADISSYESATGSSRAANLGAGSISGKSRPYTGVILAEAPSASGNAVSADLVLTNGVLAKVGFDAPSLKLAKGFYYDVEARAKTGDSAYVHVVASPKGALDGKALAAKILAADGRYGAFGPATDVVVRSETKKDDVSFIDLAFSAITPGGSSTPRRAVLAATAAPGSPDVLVLVASSSESRWAAGGEAAARAVAGTWRVESTRPTKLKPDAASDYRFEQQGGMRLPSNPLDGFSTEPAFGSAGGLGGSLKDN